MGMYLWDILHIQDTSHPASPVCSLSSTQMCGFHIQTPASSPARDTQRPQLLKDIEFPTCETQSERFNALPGPPAPLTYICNAFLDLYFGLGCVYIYKVYLYIYKHTQYSIKNILL